MPKKQSPNAFFYFMKDYKKREEEKGNAFPGGWPDIAAACGDEWKNMTAQQKGPYEARVKNAKIRNGQEGMKYTSQGVPLTLIEREVQREHEFKEKMIEYLTKTITMTSAADLPLQKFFFIHVNWFCRCILPNTTSHFVPAEFAVAQFTLANGVEKVYHEIVNSKIPLGYACEAREHSKGTHCIGVNPDNGETNFEKMYRNFMKFIKDETADDSIPPLFTIKGGMEVVPSLLEDLSAAVGQTADMFRVYPIEELFHYLRNAAAANSNSTGFPGGVSLADIELQKDYFSYRTELACYYHKSIDSALIHCSMSVVKRWAFTICDHCCVDLDVELVPGRNCPINADIHRGTNLNNTLSMTTPNNSRPSSVMSMTGVSEIHRIQASARTHKDEERRRQAGKPLIVMDHGLRQERTNVEPIPSRIAATNSIQPHSYASTIASNRSERPLRLPTTKSYAMMGAGSDQAPGVDLDEHNFPTIAGRGKHTRRIQEKSMPSFGRGRGLLLGD